MTGTLVEANAAVTPNRSVQVMRNFLNDCKNRITDLKIVNTPMITFNDPKILLINLLNPIFSNLTSVS